MTLDLKNFTVEFEGVVSRWSKRTRKYMRGLIWKEGVCFIPEFYEKTQDDYKESGIMYPVWDGVLEVDTDEFAIKLVTKRCSHIDETKKPSDFMGDLLANPNSTKCSKRPCYDTKGETIWIWRQLRPLTPILPYRNRVYFRRNMNEVIAIVEDFRYQELKFCYVLFGYYDRNKQPRQPSNRHKSLTIFISSPTNISEITEPLRRPIRFRPLRATGWFVVGCASC